MKKYLFSSAALVVAVIFAAFTYQTTNTEATTGQTEYFYRFDGTPGQESNMSKWTQISSGEYNSLDCEGTTKSCKIKNTTNSGGHPTSVPLSGGLPAQTGANTEVVNKD